MNTIKYAIAHTRERMCDSLSHIGWMFWGQGCDCGKTWPNLNRPAERIARYLDTLEYDDNYDCKQWQGRVLWHLGDFFARHSARLINGPMMQEYFEFTKKEGK